jgi:hypothetical protein
MPKAKPSTTASSSALIGFETRFCFAAVFVRPVEPLLAQIFDTIHHSRALATLRDTPLPMLLSGELSLPAEALAQAGGARGNYPALPDRSNRREMKP